MLASIVLVGLIFYICELYVDDVIIHGNSEEEFLDNLRKVFERFRKFNITVNPNKTFLGMTEIEFVGHTIDEKGITFSREKIDKVLSIPEPVYGVDLKKFLGVTGYFHNHIKNYAEIASPLQKMIKAYERNKKLIWTEEGKIAFHHLKKAINDCPTLYFLDDTSPICLHTDASNYGIGGYLFKLLTVRNTQ